MALTEPKTNNKRETETFSGPITPGLSVEERLEKIERVLREHKHLGDDGSREFDGDTIINAKGVIISGSNTQKSNVTSLPLAIVEGSDQYKAQKRSVGAGISIQGIKDTDTEQLNFIFIGQKIPTAEDIETPPNKYDFNSVNGALFRFLHVPQGEISSSGPTLLPPLGFVVAHRTPAFASVGTITQGGNTITDGTAAFEPDSFVLSVINLLDSEGNLLESRRITSNTTNTITIDNYPYAGLGAWSSATGSYTYSIVTPVLLGEAGTPFARLYVGDDIRLGYGTSSGSDTRFIKWGNGSPEGVVTANIGSMYLRFDGSTTTTLYIKTANNGSATGWTGK